MSEWYYKCMSEVLGPLSAGELKLEADAGRILPDTAVRKGADGKWVMAHNVQGLLRPPATDVRGVSPPPAVRPTPLNRPTPDIESIQSTSEAKVKHFPIRALVLFGIVLVGAALWWFKPVSRVSIVANSENAVAHIRGNFGQGTGFMVGPRLMVTNRHVIAMEPDLQLQIAFPSQRDESASLTARVIYEDPDADLALLEISAKQDYLNLARGHKFIRGEEVIVIGNPGVGKEVVLENAVSSGLLSTTTKIDGNEYYQLDISINPGNSGGPAIDGSGRVIGVVTMKATDQEGLGFCIPLATLQAALAYANDLSESEKSKNSSMHNLQSVVRLIAAMGEVYKLAMGIYVDSMAVSIRSGSSSQRGLGEVQPTIYRLVREYDDATVGKVEVIVSRLGTDPNIPDSVRQMFVEAWANYKELQSYVDTPRGSLGSYRAKYRELSDKQQRLIESLKLLAGMKVYN